MTRRTFLSAALLAGRPALGATELQVAYAGSMASAMEGPIGRAAEAMGLKLQGRAQGASGLAQLIVAGSLRPDVFISITPSPMQTVQRAGKARRAVPIARTEMVIAYSPHSRFRAEFERAARDPEGHPWWRVLGAKGLRFGRTDPITDPQGRNILFVFQLAARLYGQADLVRRILGPDINPAQIFSEPTVQARLQSGELDAASAYKIQPDAFGLPYVSLPPAINLADDSRSAEYSQATLTLNERVFHPEPLVYYAAVMTGTDHPAEAARFVDWLGGREAQEIFRKMSYGPAGSAQPLGA